MNIKIAVFLTLYAFVHNAAGEKYERWYQDNYVKWYSKVSEKRQVSDADAAVFKGIEQLRQLIAAGDESLHLDPLQIASIGPISYSAASIAFDFTLKNVQVEGIKTFKLEDVIVDTANHVADIKVSLPWISVSGHYIVNAAALLIPEPASGSFDGFITNPVVDLRVTYSHSAPGHVHLVSLDVAIAPGTTSIKLSNYGGSQILNNMINVYVRAAAANNLENELPFITKVIAKEASPYVSGYLINHDFGDVPLRSNYY